MVAAIPWIAIPMVPFGIIFFVLQWYFFRTSRNVKRLDCTSEYQGSQVGMAMQNGSIYTVIHQASGILQILSSGISHQVNIRLNILATVSQCGP